MIRMKSQILEETLNKSLNTDSIYDIAWYAYFLYKTGRLNKYDEIVINLSEKLSSLLATTDDRLRLLLYRRQIGVGLLLGYYVLEEIGVLSSKVERLKIIYELIKKYDWYRYSGELLYVLKLLARSRRFDISYNEVTNIINRRLSNLQKNLGSYRLTANEVRDLCYLILSKISKGKPRKEIEDILFSEYFQSKVCQSIEAYALYLCALSHYILAYPKVLLIKNAKSFLRALKNIRHLKYPKDLSLNLKAKLWLSQYYYKRAIERLNRYIKLRKEKTILGFESIAVMICTYIIAVKYYNTILKSIPLNILPDFIVSYLVPTIYLILFSDLLTRAFSDYNIVKGIQAIYMLFKRFLQH